MFVTVYYFNTEEIYFSFGANWMGGRSLGRFYRLIISSSLVVKVVVIVDERVQLSVCKPHRLTQLGVRGGAAVLFSV
jgi:hypothetical protein